MIKPNGNETAEKYKMDKDTRSIREDAEKDKLVKKEALLVLKRIKNNMVLLKTVDMFPNVSKIIVPGKQFFNTKNEPVFEVLLVGEKTDDFATEVKVGDKVIVSNAMEGKFNAVSKVVLKDGTYAGYYHLANLNDIMFVVDYDKIES